MSTQNLAVPRWRKLLLLLALGLALVALAGRIVTLQVWPDYERGFVFLQAQGAARSVRTVAIPAVRGMILDRDGRPLAVSTPVISLWADPALVSLGQAEIASLADRLGVSAESLQLKLQNSSGRRFVYLQRGMIPSRRAEFAPYLGRGIYLMEEFRRYYPTGEVSAQLVGFTNIDEQGQEGVELSLNQHLHGSAGSLRVIRDLQGRVVETAEVVQAARPGDDLTLTIDSRLQFSAYRELKAAVLSHGASSGALVTMDVETGEILAMVNQPAFNPNNRSDIQPAAVRNRALTDLFEPGSTIKAFTLLAALETGRYRPDTLIDTAPGRLRVDGKLIYDPVNYGVLTLKEVLAKSSQVGTARIALDLNPEDLASLLQRVGLGGIPGTGFPGEVAGSVPQRFNWEPIEQATLAYGYGLSVSAMQLAQAYAVFGNGGLLVAPRLYKDSPSMPPQRVADEGLVGEVLEMLRAAVDEGTGSAAAVPNFSVAGKTGTVHLVGDEGYELHKYSAVFAGLAPADNPRIVTVVVINDPRTDDYSGGKVAAPVFAATTQAAMRILGQAPNGLAASIPLPVLAQGVAR